MPITAHHVAQYVLSERNKKRKEGVMHITQGFNLAEFFCEEMTLKNYDPRSLQLDQIDLRRLGVAQPHWTTLDAAPIRLGADAFKACWLHRDELPPFLREHEQLYFDGDLLLNRHKQECVLYLRWTRKDWNIDEKERGLGKNKMDWRWGVASIHYNWGRSFPALVLR